MNRNLILWFIGGAVFVVSLVAGAFAADGFRDDGGGDLSIPSASGQPIPLIQGVDVTGVDDNAVFAADTGFVPTEVAGEYVRLDAAPPEDAGGFADDGSGGPSGDDGEDVPIAPGEVEPPPGEGRGYPWEVDDPLGDDLFGDPLFSDFSYPLLRFLDYCADHPEDPACPPGVGGTVLVPLDSDLTVGEFRLNPQLYSLDYGWWTCEPPSGLRSDQYFLLIQANHPARIEIDYYADDDPGAVRSVVVDLTDPTNPAFGDFLATVTETGSPPGTGVHHCFVLEAEQRSQLYVIEARATSFTGETDFSTYFYRTPEQRRRPPIQIAPQSDYRATLTVPVKSEPRQDSVVRLITQDEGFSCSDIEDVSIVTRQRTTVVFPEPGAPSSGYRGRERVGDDIINAPDWRYDPAWDTNQFWELNLKEGNTYTVCVWWVESPERSYDPARTTIVERETANLTPPNLLRASVALVAIEATSSQDVEPFSFSLSGGRLGSGCFYQWRPDSVRLGATLQYDPGILFCDWGGYEQPALIEFTAVLDPYGDDSEEETRVFVVGIPTGGEPRTERVRLDLTYDPTTRFPGPFVNLDVTFTEGDRSGGPDLWRWRAPVPFDPPPREPTELPELPQIDWLSSGVEGASRSQLNITANFDRPVTLQASLDTSVHGELTEQCFTGDIPTFSSSELRASYVFPLRGLCTYTEYAVRLEATDEAGSTRVFTNPFGLTDAENETNWPAHGRTLGNDVSYQVNYRAGLASESEVFAFGVTVADRRTDLFSGNRCLVTRTTPFQTATWGDEEIPVEIFVDVAGANLVDGLCRRAGRFAIRYDAYVTTSFTIEEFRRGPIEIPVTLENIRGSGSLRIVVVIQGGLDR